MRPGERVFKRLLILCLLINPIIFSGVYSQESLDRTVAKACRPSQISRTGIAVPMVHVMQLGDRGQHSLGKLHCRACNFPWEKGTKVTFIWWPLGYCWMQLAILVLLHLTSSKIQGCLSLGRRVLETHRYLFC